MSFDHEFEYEYENTNMLGMGWLMTMLIWAISFFCMWYFFSQRDFVGTFAVLGITVSAFMGFNYGVARFVASLSAIIAAVWFAPELGLAQEARLSELIGTTGLFNRILSVGAIGILILFLGGWLVSSILCWLADRDPRIAKLNGWLGFGVGGIQSAAVLLILLGGLFVIEPMAATRSNEQSLAEAGVAKKVADKMLRVTDLTRQSSLAPFIQKYNPFTVFPELNKFEQIQKTVAVLGNPNKINRLLQDPSLRQLQDRPEIGQAVEELLADNEIKGLLDSEQQIDRNTAFQLLQHPAVLRLVDLPGFMAEATRIINESNLLSENAVARTSH